jgi:hypothetical protein
MESFLVYLAGGVGMWVDPILWVSLYVFHRLFKGHVWEIVIATSVSVVLINIGILSLLHAGTASYKPIIHFTSYVVFSCLVELLIYFKKCHK